MKRNSLSAIIFVVLLCSDIVSAQKHSDTAAFNVWRNEWFAYERELQEWCTKNSPAALDACMQREMAKHGVSPAFFATLHAGGLPAPAPPSASGPVPAPSQNSREAQPYDAHQSALSSLLCQKKVLERRKEDIHNRLDSVEGYIEENERKLDRVEKSVSNYNRLKQYNGNFMFGAISRWQDESIEERGALDRKLSSLYRKRESFQESMSNITHKIQQVNYMINSHINRGTKVDENQLRCDS